MKFYLKEWTDDSVSVMDEKGQVVGNFVSIEDAIEAYDWTAAANDDDLFDVGIGAVDASSVGI